MSVSRCVAMPGVSVPGVSMASGSVASGSVASVYVAARVTGVPVRRMSVGAVTVPCKPAKRHRHQTDGAECETSEVEVHPLEFASASTDARAVPHYGLPKRRVSPARPAR